MAKKWVKSLIPELYLIWQLLFQIAEKNGIIHLFNIASGKPILSLHCGLEPLLTADWSFSNSLLIAAAVRSDLVIYDLSKMAIVSKKKIAQDIVKSVKLAPFSDFILATAAQPNYCVQVMNVRSNQTLPIIQKEPINGIGWMKQRQVLVSS